MRTLETYFKICFGDYRITNDRIEDFTIDSIAKFEINNGDHYWDAAITDTKAVLLAFQDKKTDKTETLHDQVASTITVDEYEDKYVALVRNAVGSITSMYPKNGPVYKEFFLKPMAYYTRPKRSLITVHIDHFIERFDAHSELPGSLKQKFTDLKTEFDPARSTQVHNIASVGTLIVETSVERQDLNVQLFKNVLSVALRYPGHPEYASVYFDQSKLFHHPIITDDDIEEEDYVVSLMPNETKNSGLVNIIGKKARFVSLSGGQVQIYTVATLDHLDPGTESVTLEEDGDITMRIEQLGDDTNPYLILRNLGAEPAQVIIEWVE